MTYYVRVRSYKDYLKAVEVLAKHTGKIFLHYNVDTTAYNYIAFEIGDYRQCYYNSLGEVMNHNTPPFIELKIPKQIKYNTYLLRASKGSKLIKWGLRRTLSLVVPIVVLLTLLALLLQ